MTAVRRTTGLCVLFLLCAAAARAQVVPTGFLDEPVVQGLNLPTAFAFVPDGRILVAEKSGVVRVIRDGVLLPTPLIDLQARVNDYWDRGLLGLAVDPDFATNGAVYLLYVYEGNPAAYSGPKTSRLTRVTAVGDTASPASEVVLLGNTTAASCKDLPAGADCIPADNASHAAGAIRVAPDGTLFVTSGDASSFNVVDPDALRSQDLDSLAGKLMHVTRDGKGVPTNPFWTGDADANRSKVWAYGFRNPFRFGLHPGSGVPYVADVGWSTWEEVNVATPGGNFGWPCYEGVGQQPGYAPLATCQALYAQGTSAVRAPLTTYPHNGAGAGITGGAFYSGTAFPSEYQGAYFYGDYARRDLQVLRTTPDHALVDSPNVFATEVAGPVDIQTDGSYVWYIAIETGTLRRIRYAAAGGGGGLSGYVSDMTWTDPVSNGLGPAERDRSNGGSAAGDGGPITLNGVTYAKGVGVHAPSDIRIALGSTCTTFTAAIGVDDEVGANGSVTFEVWGDATRLYDSVADGVLTGASATRQVNVPISGYQALRLVVTGGGDGTLDDHADWADARVTCGGPAADITAPRVTTVSPTAGAGGVATSAPVVVTFSEDMAPSTLTPSTVLVTVAGSTTPVQGTVSYDAASAAATLTPAAPLGANTTYTARVRGGAEGVKDVAGNALTADVTWSFTTSAAATGVTKYLSDLTWTSAANYWGPVERDQSNGESAAGDGRPITLNGTVYAKGLGLHAPSEVVVPLGGTCTTFLADVGLDDEVFSAGSAAFLVFADGVLLYDSRTVGGLMTGASPTRQVSVDVTGRSELRLVTSDGDDGMSYDHADWADARLVCDSTTANRAPQAVISSPQPTQTFKVGDVISFAGSGSDPEDGTLVADSLAWDVVIQHCPGGTCHAHPLLQTRGSTGSFTAPDHGDDSYLVLTLTARDSQGLTGKTSVTIRPQTVQITVATSPAGLQVTYGGTTTTAPATFTSIVGSRQTISVASPQGGYTFGSWSDGGAQQHTIVAGTADATYTAYFTTGGGGEPVTKYVSDLTWTSSSNFWGPVERDRSNGENAAGDGLPITINGTVYPKGLGVHAPSEVVLPLDGSCTTFLADVGVDDEVGNLGSVTFRVLGDGVLLYDSTVAGGLLTGASPARPVSVDVGGRTELRLVVTDGDGSMSYDHADWAGARLVCGTPTTTNRAPQAAITAPLATQTFTVGEVISFAGAATDPEDGTLPAASLAWRVAVQRCVAGTCQAEPLLQATGASGSFLAPDPGDGGSLVLTLTASDSQGLTGTASVTLQPQTVQITLATSPAGLQVTYGTTMAAAPATFTSVVGASRTIGVASPQNGYTFSSWSDGGAQQHAIVVGGTNATYTADFAVTGGTGDTTPPTVTGVAPTSKAAALNAVVTATFSEAMAPATLTASTVQVRAAGAATAVAATVAYDAATRTVRLTPSAPLATSTTYTATVKGGQGGAADAAGNTLAVDRVWTFTTKKR